MKLSPTLASIRDIFESELRAAGGSVVNRFEDGQRMYLRGVLPVFGEARPGDRIQAGVALRTAEEQILVHPYTFRQVCSNGAIMVYAARTEPVERVADMELRCESFEVSERLREAVRACADPSAFDAGLSQMQAATQAEATMITLMPLLSRMPAQVIARLVSDVMERLGPDRSRYALMNAVTSTARDTSDPDLRWQLEAIGGAVAAGIEPAIPARSEAAQRAVPV
jgi:hypothetical protein